jgi:surfeit locus 1 family protein
MTACPKPSAKSMRPLCRWGYYSFSPRLLPTLVTLFLIPILAGLGYWQFQRAEQKRVLRANYEQRMVHSPLTLATLATVPDPQFYPLQVSGHFDNEHLFFLDNKIYQHRIGYEIVAPFIPSDGSTAVLVNRGWIAIGKNRQTLPIIPAIKDKITLTGLIDIPQLAFKLGANTENQQGWPRRIQSVIISDLAKQVGYSLRPFIMLQNSDEISPYPRAWTPINVTPTRHLGYALQWFALALALLIVYFVVNTVREDKP